MGRRRHTFESTEWTEPWHGSSASSRGFSVCLVTDYTACVHVINAEVLIIVRTIKLLSIAHSLVA